MGAFFGTWFYCWLTFTWSFRTKITLQLRSKTHNSLVIGVILDSGLSHLVESDLQYSVLERHLKDYSNYCVWEQLPMIWCNAFINTSEKIFVFAVLNYLVLCYHLSILAQHKISSICHNINILTFLFLENYWIFPTRISLNKQSLSHHVIFSAVDSDWLISSSRWKVGESDV